MTGAFGRLFVIGKVSDLAHGSSHNVKRIVIESIVAHVQNPVIFLVNGIQPRRSFTFVHHARSQLPGFGINLENEAIHVRFAFGYSFERSTSSSGATNYNEDVSASGHHHSTNQEIIIVGLEVSHPGLFERVGSFVIWNGVIGNFCDPVAVDHQEKLRAKLVVFWLHKIRIIQVGVFAVQSGFLGDHGGNKDRILVEGISHNGNWVYGRVIDDTVSA
mmetsp:Transcript_25280/g.59591  ORF Transcript_25280/g.59591 Transcript_25280/m.59591 type:complete len:217 (+) Transcript_25280:2782-3432(+)